MLIASHGNCIMSKQLTFYTTVTYLDYFGGSMALRQIVPSRGAAYNFPTLVNLRQAEGR
jgi:hypothetical protein